MPQEEDRIVPPVESTKPKPKMMKIVPPVESTKPKPKFLQKIYKVYGKWSYAYFFLICVVSLFLLNQPNYLTEIFPVLVYFGFIVLFINHLVWSNRLRFCKFKKWSTVALILYFITCILAVILKLDVYLYLGYFFAAAGFILFLFTFKNLENE